MFEVYVAEKEVKVKEPTRLKLNQSFATGEVRMVAVDRDGQEKTRGSILAIRTDGTLKLYTSINRALGFNLDEHGKIAVN